MAHGSKTTFLDGPSAFRRMAADAAQAASIDIAVAWTGDVLGGGDPAFDWLAAHADRIRLVTGVTDGLSCPRTLHRAHALFDRRGLWIVHPELAPMFHAKVYVFRSVRRGDRVRDVVYAGSANLSRGAASAHSELVSRTELQGGLVDEVLEATLSPPGLFPASEGWLDAYAAWAEAARAARRDLEAGRPPAPPPPRAPVSGDVEGGDGVLQPDFYRRWPDHLAWYRRQVASRSDGLGPEHWLRVRAAVLAMPGWPDPTAMDETDWKRACGLAGGNHPVYGVDDERVNWPLFGSVDARSPVADLGLLQRKHLVRDALAAIPATGEIGRDDWTRFRMAWREAGFGDESKAAASRLLALRRPDRFLPLTNASVEAIGRVVGRPPTTLSAYKEVCDALWRAPWVRHAEPPEDPDDQAIWEARVALLDVLFYDPTVR
ncbi:MAG: phospholipase D family protein [Alphaproteobacteria bacterium]|nr:phospholipase D family protein [Alphaproteobacteria bacterium]